jgi:Uma2 family endonuclease
MLQPETRTLRHPAASASVRPAPDAFFLTLAPDWICEVLSPGSARFDCKKKMPIHSQAGVRNGVHVGVVRACEES